MSVNYIIGGGNSKDRSSLNLLRSWSDYDSSKANRVITAELSKDIYDKTNDNILRLSSLEENSIQSISVEGTGNALTSISKEGNLLLFKKETSFPILGETELTAYRGDRGKIAYDHSQLKHQVILNGYGFVKVNGEAIEYDDNDYSLSSHNHDSIYEPVFTKNTAFNKNFGTTEDTVSEGNHTHDYAATNHSHLISDISDLQSILDETLTVISISGNGNAISSVSKSGNTLSFLKGSFAELDENNKIISSQLPSYVDDILEYSTLLNFPEVGESGKIYVSIDTNLAYRWSGTTYTVISPSLALGETSSTAYRGDRGKTAYDHSQSEHQTIIDGTGFVKATGKVLSYDNNSYSLSSHNHNGIYEPANSNIQNHITSQDNPHNVTKDQIGLSNVDNTSDSNKPISTAVQGALDLKANTDHTHSEYLTSFTESDPTVPEHVKAITTQDIEGWNTNQHTHNNKSTIDSITESHLEILNKFSIVGGKLQISIDTYSTGELSAYGLGDESESSNGALSTLIDVKLTNPVDGQYLKYNGTHWINTNFPNITSDWSEITNKPTTLSGYGISSSDTLFDGKYAALSHIHSFSSLADKPTTLSGYGIEDAYTKTNIDNALLAKLDKSVFDDLFEKVEVSAGVFAIKAKYNFYGVGEVSAYGLGSETNEGSGVVELNDLVDVTLTTPVNGNVLVYNGTHWVNLPQSAITPDLSGYATQTYVNTQIAGLVNSAPTTLDTLNELAAALGDDPNFATTVTNMIAGKEDAIAAGTTAQYWRGDKTWQTLNTAAVPESGNLYFTNARVKSYADTLYLPLSGNAVSATKLATSRNFSITGGATAAAVSFNGTDNVVLNVTALDASKLGGTIPSAVLGNSTFYLGTTAIKLNQASGSVVNITGLTSVNIGSAVLKYDSANNALYVEKSDGTAVNFYSTGELSAYGVGSGTGSGASYNRLDAWADYDSSKSGWVLSALLGNDLNTRVTSLESGSALNITTTGTGNAVTAISKSGNTITATKGSTFSLEGHTHDYLPLSGGTMSNTNLVNSLNADLLDGNHGSYYTGYADSLVNNLVIGGRNLLIKSNRLGTYQDYADVKSGWIFKWIPGDRYKSAIFTNLKLEKNTDYTASFLIWSDSNISGFSADLYPDTLPQLSNINAFTTVRRVVWTFNSGNNDDLFACSFRIFCPANISTYVYAADIKLEKGNKATDWTPAPEDVDASIALVQTNLNTHILNTSNPHSVTKAQVGLSNVDNTSDANKPISTATQTALNGKLNLTGGTLSGNLSFSNLVSNIRLSTGGEGNAYIGSSGMGAPPSGELDYGVYISSNAYRDADGKWYHGRTSSIPAYRFKAGLHNHFVWSYSPNVGAGEITFTDLMTLRSDGSLGIGTTNPLYKLDVSGDGRFTGNVTAPTFIGALSGNASSATNLSRSILAGNGLSGGGVLNADRTLTLGTPSNITATSTNSVTETSHTHKLSMGAGSGLDADLLDGVHNGDITAVAVRNRGGISNGILPDSFPQGLTINSVYASDFPFRYGNTLTINNLGSSQLFITWNNAQTPDNPNVAQDIYVRSRRDVAGNNWSVWTRLLTNNNIGSFNAGSATKLKTARTIWGQSFDGTANVTGALTGATTIAASTSVTTPKVIFSAGGWSLEQSGTEIQFKYNGTIKQRLLNDGSIVATGELTAYGAAT